MGQDVNTLDVTVDEVLYLGPDTKYQLAPPVGPADRGIREPREANARELQRGDRVRVGWSVDDGLLVGDPGQRLTSASCGAYRWVLVSSRLSGRPWVMRMRWRDLLFAHWAVDVDLLRPLIPRSLEIDTHDGRAYLGIVPFGMEDTAPRGLPRVPYLSDFPRSTCGRTCGPATSGACGSSASTRVVGWRSRPHDSASTCRISTPGCRSSAMANGCAITPSDVMDVASQPGSTSVIARQGPPDRPRRDRSTRSSPTGCGSSPSTAEVG